MRRPTVLLVVSLLAACGGRPRHSTYIQPWSAVLCEGIEYVEVSNNLRYAVAIFTSVDPSHPSSAEFVGTAPPGLTSIPLAGTSAQGRPAGFEARRDDEAVQVGVRMIRRCDSR
jgi:hypothetical protein